jgi:uncharacterized protein YgiM (DUF1202 family)
MMVAAPVRNRPRCLQEERMQVRHIGRPVPVAAMLTVLALLALAACSAPTQTRVATAAAPAQSGTSGGAAENHATVAPTAKSYISVHTLNLRTGPNHRFAAKTVLPVGTVVTPNGFVSGSWWQVDTQNFGTGWVDSTGLKPNAG